jgi:hypothetical protein
MSKPNDPEFDEIVRRIRQDPTFRQLADTINASFARWDLGHLYAFRLEDGSEVGIPDEDGDEDEPVRHASRAKIATRAKGELFEYEFDFGDSWLHRCTILETEVAPDDVYGKRPKGPVAIWGWGSIPDQYGRTTPDG